MGVDAKDIQVLMSRILKFSIDVLCRFVQKHPILSSVLLFLLVLYLFLPKVFLFLICSSPFLACAAVYIRFYLPSKGTKIQNDAKDGKKDSAVLEPEAADHVLSRNDASIAQSQTMSQRNVKEKNKQLDARATEEKNVVSSVSPDIDSTGTSVLIEEKPDNGEIISRNVSVGEDSEAFSKASKSSVTSLDGLEEQAAKSEGGGGEAELESSSSEEEGEAQKGTNKAVEWTEDDQKNLMDLGISELERNKRLESLIARRRARKLYKMNTEKISTHVSTAQIPVAPVLVARGNLFGAPNDPDEKIPGSAPSLPTRNPFDLPYDPLEEKPNLMADSFQQEFMPAFQKEMFFCRHESFTWGPSFPLEGMHNHSDVAGHSTLQKEQDKGNHDWLVDHLLNQDDKPLRRSLSITDLVTEEGESSNQVENKPEEDGEADPSTDIKGKKIENTHGSDSSLDKGSEIPIATLGIKHNRSESSLSSLSDDDNEPTIKAKKTAALSKIQPPVFRFPEIVNNPSPNSNPCPIPKARGVNETSYLASPATIDRSRLDNHLLYTNNGPWHTPTNSIASDMQVEVSEIGSPPLTGDGSASSNDGESLTYDGDVEKEITSGSDEMWGVSPHAPRDQEQDMTSREVNDFDGEDTAEGFSGFHKESEAPFASSSRLDMPQDVKTDSSISEHKISNDLEKHEGNLQKPQEPLSLSEKTAEKVESSHSVNVSDHMNDDSGRSKSVEERSSGAENSVMSEVGDFSEPAQEINSESSKHNESKSLDTPVQSVEEVEMAYSSDDPAVHANVPKEDIKSNEDMNGRIDKYIEQEVLLDLSKRAEESISESANNPENNSDMPLANLSFLIPIQDGIQEQSTTEFEVSSTNQSSNDPSTSGIQLEMAVGQASPVSNTSSSPKSVLPDRIPLAETLSDLNQHMQMDVPEYDMEKIARDHLDKLLDEQLAESVVLISDQNGQHVTEDSTNHPSVNMPQRTEETSDTSGKSTNEAKEVANLNEPMLDDGGTKEDIRSEASISIEDSAELSKPPEEINSISVEQIDDKSGNLIEHETRTDQTEPEKEHHDSEVPGLAVRGEELRNTSQASTQDADGNSGAKDLTENRTATIPTNPAVEGDHVDMAVNVGAEEEILVQNSTATRDALANETTSMDRIELVGDGEHESKGLDRKEATSEQSNVTEDPPSGSIQVTDTGSSTENAIDNVPFQPARESNSLSDMTNIDSAAQQEGKDSSKPVEDIKSNSEYLTQDGTETDQSTKKLVIAKMEAPMLEDSYEHISTP
ncbi:conserved hypothetical protein [Ricinus communis]|uniref:Uncharacterized protein n=1 Tax=Ricinus communis TaxID=3988 RepID=B9SHY0_RICCO|nr:conserved hypothetical protein [Ricinus communis]|eukprot:XP_002525599.1 dentin sialophosphoprotein [Ricinus communis]